MYNFCKLNALALITNINRLYCISSVSKYIASCMTVIIMIIQVGNHEVYCAYIPYLVDYGIAHDTQYRVNDVHQNHT